MPTYMFPYSCGNSLMYSTAQHDFVFPCFHSHGTHRVFLHLPIMKLVKTNLNINPLPDVEMLADAS